MSQKRKKNPDQTDVKFSRGENISLVTGNQVRQFYADEDRDSYKVERTRLFQNNPTPPHHYRYIPQRQARKTKSKKSNFCFLSLKAKNKKLLSYCLIYVLMFACAMTLLYLFYTPKQMNLFGFYTKDNLRLKFYRFVLGGNASTTITPKIITTTEPTKFFTHTSTLDTSSVSTSIKTRPYSVTWPPTIIKVTTTTARPKILHTTTASTGSSTMTSSISDVNIEKNTSEANMENKIEDLTKNKLFTTCITVDATNSTELSVNKKLHDLSTKSFEPTVSSVSVSTIRTEKMSTSKSKIIEVLNNSSTSTIATTILPKDNSTETLEFNEKFSYSNTQLNNMDKNETTYDETIVDNGILPTEDEEEERKKDEIESKQKIASFFGVDPITGKEKDDVKEGFFRKVPNRPSTFDKVDEMNKIVSNMDSSPKQMPSNRWLLNGNQQFARGRDFAPTKSPKDDEFKYQPMLKLLYGSCYGGCNS